VSVYTISPYTKCDLDKTAGGDLMTMLIKYDIFSEDVSRFYMAECILAIEAVHKLGYIHRCVPFNLFDAFRFIIG
jgi:serine/threonine protein kinase